MKHFFLLLMIVLISSNTFSQKNKDVVDYVNPLMGTQSTYFLSNGNTYPAIARPWGINF